MVIVMTPAAGDTDIDTVIAHIEAHGGQAFVSKGVARTIVGVVGSPDVLETLDAEGLPGVDHTVRITAPYKLVSAQNHSKRTTVRVGGVPIGPDTFTLIAGPCAVETAEQTMESARMAQRAGATNTTVPGSHAVYLTQSGVVSDVIATAARGALVAA